MDREKENIYQKNSVVTELVYTDFMFFKNKKLIVKDEFKDKKGLVMFYAPCCTHCKKRAKMWEELGCQFLNKFFIAAVNVENIKKDNDLIKLEYNVKMYPTVFYATENGILHKYDGVLNKDDIICFIWEKI